jgi:uncharacterized membrane protein
MTTYFDEVENYLQDIPQAEREDMLTYYREYALDANFTEAHLIQKYGKPRQFARQLRAQAALAADDEHTQQAHKKRQDKSLEEKTHKNRVWLIWAVVIGLFATPGLFVAALAVAGVVIGGLAALFGLLFGGFVLLVTLVVSGLFGIVVGASVIGQSIASALFFMFAGLGALGLALLIAPIAWGLGRLGIDLMTRFVKYVSRKVSSRQKEKTHA